MEPLTWGVVLTTIIIPGVIGNRADAVVCNGFKSFINYLKQEDSELVNHDLQKALKRSFLSALQSIASECKGELNDPSFRESFKYTDRNRLADLGWLVRKIKQLKTELTEIEKLEYVETPIESLNEIELLLTLEGSLVEERVQTVKQKLVNDALQDNLIPSCYRQKIEQPKTGLFERMCAYFAFEIKNNQVVNNIFQRQLLVQINQNLVEEKLTIQNLADSLRNVARDVPQVMENLSKLERAIEQGNYKLDKSFGDVLAAVTSSSASIEEIKVLLEKLIRDGDRALPLNIDWRSLCGQVLAKQQEDQRLRRKVTERGFELNIYVPLGLVERRQQQRRTGDVAREDVYQLQEQVITKEYHYDAFLSEVVGESSKGNKHIAIVGEPGAGKTTLLDNIASWINANNKGLPICIPLSGLQGKTLEEYLLKNWLEEALNFIDEEVRRDKSAVQKSLEECFRAGGVWLLLDGLDEMAVTSTGALVTIQEQLRGWVAKARVVLTSRLNIWDARVNNPLANFETYRTLEFSEAQVNEFIQGWFAVENVELGRQLQVQLKESQYQRLQELVKNPLRLALLCQTWYYQQGDLPETKAGLYQRFVRDFYGEWKSEYHPITWKQQQELNQALGKLALVGIGSEARFRLREELGYAVMGYPLFKLACDRGWLNLVDRDAKKGEVVYAFFHPTFQEYFAALAINNWDFFLPCSHKNKPVID